MTPDDFRRIALRLEGAEEGSHMGAADFRVGGRIFATLAAEAQGYGNLMLTPEQQAGFVAEAPHIFIPVHGGWGRNGATHLKLAAANEDLVYGALQTAWKLRIEKNRKAPKPRAPKSPAPAKAKTREDGKRSHPGDPPKKKTSRRKITHQ
jgi:YjbR protein